MNVSTIKKIIKLNKSLYLNSESKFSQSRNFYWEGFYELLSYFHEDMEILDVGCGNGRFGEFLSNKVDNIKYSGLDFSEVLLTDAKDKLEGKIDYQLLHEDITDLDWQTVFDHRKYDVITCFSVLHHIPSYELRYKILFELKNILKPGGVIIITSWQIQNGNEINQKKVNPMEFQIDPRQLETRDFIIDWKSGEGGYRFIHIINENEILDMAKNCGMNVIKQFYSDGKNKKMNLYSILKV